MLQSIKYFFKSFINMKSFSLKYENQQQLEKFILTHEFKNEKECLVQVFSGVVQKKFLQELCSSLLKLIPQAHIIGATTGGEISKDQVSTGEIIVSVSVFNDVKLRSYFIEGENSFENAQDLYKMIGSDKTPLMIVFADGAYSKGDALLKGFEKQNRDIIIAGGLAGNNLALLDTFVIHNKKVFSKGLVGVSFESESLEINTHYSFDWVAVGLEMKITRSKDNRVYEIDGMRAYDVYKKYLGEKAVSRLHYIGLEFPLIFQENGVDIARVIVKTYKDGSFLFAGDLAEGTTVRFGIGNPELILQNARKRSQLINNFPVESVFIYSCMARQRFLKEHINIDIDGYCKDIPLSGFFTNGEFFCSGKKKSFLNQSTTVLMLSENKEFQLSKKIVEEKKQNIQEVNEQSVILETLAHLINVTSSNVQKLNETLEHRVEDKIKELEKSTKFFQKIFETSNEGIWVVNLKKETMMANSALCKMLGFSENELMSKTVYDFVDEIGKKRFDKNIKLMQKGESSNQYELELINKYRKRIYCILNTEFLCDEEGETIGLFSMLTDITKRKIAEEEIISFNNLLEEKISEEMLKNFSKDKLMTKQMRHAQMGEMISMIAHQWRQPLSTISAISASIQLKMSLEDKEEEVLYSNLNKINHQVQYLSNTINDFRNFFSPNKSKSEARLCDLIDQTMVIMKQAMLQNNIDIILECEHMKRPMNLYTSEIVQVFLSLMKNSMDALLENEIKEAYLKIRGSEYKDKSVIIFEDNAGGISEEIIDKIFDPYFTTKNEKNGTGLGLYMSKLIVEKHCDGQIIVENTDVGVRFIIALNH